MKLRHEHLSNIKTALIGIIKNLTSLREKNCILITPYFKFFAFTFVFHFSKYLRALSMESDAKLSNDSQEMISFLWILRAWLLDCSAHGIPRIISSTNFRRKIFWLAAVFVSGSTLCWQIWKLVQEVQSHPITVNIKIENQNAVKFPAVTICNANKLKYSTVERLERQNSDLYKTITYTKMEPIGFRQNYENLNRRIDRWLKQSASRNSNLESQNKSRQELEKSVQDLQKSKCAKDRSYLGEKKKNQVDDVVSIEGFDRRDAEYDYSDQVSPNNEFKCKDGHCISQVCFLKQYQFVTNYLESEFNFFYQSC